MRLKAALIIVAIAFVITLANFGSSLILTRKNLTETVEKDISLALDIANELISTRISLYKSNAQTIAERLMKADTESGYRAIMRGQLEEHTDFIALTVFDRQGARAEYGDSPTPVERLRDSRYIAAAFEGQTVISTTEHDGATGKLVMYVCTPMGGDRVLSVTIPGIIFSELLDDYTLWNTGHIFMIDEEGVVIANYNHDIVLFREHVTNVLTPSSPKGTVDFFDEMLSGKQGSGNYTYDNTKYQCAYSLVSASETGWRIGLSVPVRESPVARVQNCLLSLAALFLAVSIIIAFLSSGYIAKPYKKITEQNRRLEELNIKTLQLQTELEAALAEAQEANRAKSSFLARMSHEMRTPLNAVIGLSELILSSGEVQDEVESRLDKIYTSGMTLLGLVNDILDISKIESDKFEINPIEYDMPSLINDVISLNTVRIMEMPIRFILTLDERLPSRLIGDDLRVKQIFNNLLSNAFKYTNSGSIEWIMSFQRSGDDIWLISEVRDTGIGIKPEDIPKLFSDYSQVDALTNREAEGTGLGLSITKRLVNMMDGTISVESEHGKGSTFSVRLRQKFVSDEPIGKQAADNLMNDRYSVSRRAKHARLARIDLSYAHVLVVDDIPTNLDVAEGMLMPYGIRVDCATSGMQAIDMIRAENPRYDAVFMDHMMPVMDGLEAVRIIREEIGSEYSRNVPVIALTANAIAGNESMFLAHGFNAFISKPIDVMRLDSILRVWVRNKDLENERDIARGYCVIAEHTPDSEYEGLLPGEISIYGVDTADGLERFTGNMSAYMKVLRSYSENTRQLLSDMSDYLGANNLSDYSVTVHGIKGSSFSIGALSAGADAERLEHLAAAGDERGVTAEHDAFTAYMGAVLNSIDMALNIYSLNYEKPAVASPDPLLLRELRDACEAYDAGRVDSVISLLDSVEYESGAGLVAWLRGQAEDMNYDIMSSGIWPDQNPEGSE